MPAPGRSTKRRGGFQEGVVGLADTMREVEVTLQAQVFLLVVRGATFITDRHVRRRRHRNWVPVTGCARRRKEVFKQKRDSMVRQANRISSRYGARVWIYLRRNGRWYAYTVTLRDVSSPGQTMRRSLTDSGSRCKRNLWWEGSSRERHECAVVTSPPSRSDGSLQAEYRVH